jgi:hypothetical protein
LRLEFIGSPILLGRALDILGTQTVFYIGDAIICGGTLLVVFRLLVWRTRTYYSSLAKERINARALPISRKSIAYVANSVFTENYLNHCF